MNGWMVSPLGTGLSGTSDVNLEASGNLENPALGMYKELWCLVRQSQPLLLIMVNFAPQCTTCGCSAPSCTH